MRKCGQSTIEFTFVLVAIFFITYGLIQVFRWSGMDLAERRVAFEQSLTNTANTEQQLAPDFYRSKPVTAVYRGWQK